MPMGRLPRALRRGACRPSDEQVQGEFGLYDSPAQPSFCALAHEQRTNHTSKARAGHKRPELSQATTRSALTNCLEGDVLHPFERLEDRHVGL